MANLGPALADLNDSFRERIRFHMVAWVARIGDCPRLASERGGLPAHLDLESTRRLLIHGLQGATLRMKLEREPAPLKPFVQHYFHNLVVMEESYL
jgi:TetR/AcrR family transcriptional repressor of nem operon